MTTTPSEHLNAMQFNVHALMSPKHWDTPSMGTPQQFYKNDKPYIDNLAKDIGEHGVRNSVHVHPGTGRIEDGHHRVYASYLSNQWHVPTKDYNPQEPYTP